MQVGSGVARLGAIPLSPLVGIAHLIFLPTYLCESDSMFGLGHYELLIVAGIALLLFGHRLPGVMRSLGRGVVEFKKGVNGVEDDMENAGKVEKKDDVAKP